MNINFRAGYGYYQLNKPQQKEVAPTETKSVNNDANADNITEGNTNTFDTPTDNPEDNAVTFPIPWWISFLLNGWGPDIPGCNPNDPNNIFNQVH